jgi:hypothetical protein
MVSELDPPRPGEEFTSSALRLCALAAHTLGWTPDIFWAATPAELAAILAPAGPAPLTGAALRQWMETDHG